MTQVARLVTFDHVREMLYASHLDDGSCTLIAVTHDQLEILRVCVRYAKRNINWVGEVVSKSQY